MLVPRKPLSIVSQLILQLLNVLDVLLLSVLGAHFFLCNLLPRVVLGLAL